VRSGNAKRNNADNGIEKSFHRFPTLLSLTRCI